MMIYDNISLFRCIALYYISTLSSDTIIFQLLVSFPAVQGKDDERTEWVGSADYKLKILVGVSCDRSTSD